MIRLFCAFLILFVSALNFSGPQDFDSAGSRGYTQSEVDSAKGQTTGHTGDLLAERGGDPECIYCHGEQDDDYEGVIDSVEIMEQTLKADVQSCMEWTPVGICVWMICYVVACEFDVTVKVKNYVPDLLIQSYDRANGEPWKESQDLNLISQGDSDSSWVMKLIGLVEDVDLGDIGTKGGISTQSSSGKRESLNFKLVDAYGSPGVVEYMALNATGYFCDSKVTPFFPYYISNLDSIAWRWNLPEFFYPMSWDVVTGMWDLGTKWSLNNPNNYGGEYPRHGFTTGADRLKSSVLTAHRAAHFITRSSQPHLYFSIDEDDDENWWAPDPYTQSKGSTGRWQMLYPNDEDKCVQFPYGSQPSSDRRATDGSYVWNFWREYKCCDEGKGKLIFHFG